MAWLAAGATVTFSGAAPAMAGTDACAPATVVSDVADLPDAWQQALDALVASTSVPGQPWACTGARLTLKRAPSGDGATLRVEDAQGRSAERPVATPGDLVPTGEALLASSAGDASRADAAQGPPSPPPRQPAGAATRPEGSGRVTSAPLFADDGPVEPTEPAEPRVLIGALFDTRYTGPTKAVCAGVDADLAIPFGDWSIGSWARFDWPLRTFEELPPEYLMWEASVGLSVAYRMLQEPVELRLAFAPSLAVVSMDAGVEGNEAEGSRVDPRLGLELRLVWPVHEIWRPMAAVDVEGAPAAFAGEEHRRIDPMLPLLPAYNVGLSLGLEVAIP